MAPLLAVRQAGSHRSARAIDGTRSRASLLAPCLIMVTMFGLDNPVSLAICNCDFFGFSSSTRRSTYFASRVVSKGLAGIFPYCDDTQHLLHIFVIAMRLMAISLGNKLSESMMDLPGPIKHADPTAATIADRQSVQTLPDNAAESCAATGPINAAKRTAQARRLPCVHVSSTAKHRMVTLGVFTRERAPPQTKRAAARYPPLRVQRPSLEAASR